MKAIFAVLGVLVSTFVLSFANAQTKVDLKDISTDGDTTTIQIKKGDLKDKKEVVWEIIDGSADVQGDPAPMKKGARANWKTACDDWKKEVRADNKENKVLTINCGTPTCVSESEGNVCSSKAVYKVKTKISE